MDTPRSLRILSKHTVSKPIDVRRTVVCSPHELIAIVTYTHDVVVYRLNGQIAFTIKSSQDEEDIEDGEYIGVTSLEWSPDGRRLAVAWSDGSWKIHEAERGDVVFEGVVRDEDDKQNEAVVLGFSWQQHNVQKQGSELANTDADVTSQILTADYPREVTLFDITAVLPRLSALPAHGLRMSAEGAKFANQSATDSIFASLSERSEAGVVEVLLVHISDGTIRIMLNGISHVGTATFSGTDSDTRYASSTTSASHALLSQANHALHLELLDLPLSDLNGAVLHLTSHCTMQLRALQQYIRRAVDCMHHDHATGMAVPARFIKNIAMTLDENQVSYSTLSSSLLHLAMTGQFHPDLLEWFTDIVKDTGLKRWDTSLNTMYASIETHLHSHILPALDRMTIAASKLRGLARLHQGSIAFAPEEKLFAAILKQCDAFRLLALNGLDICMSDSSMWRVFSKWLKLQIEIGAAGPYTKEAAETEERDSLGIDMTVVMQYIQSDLLAGGRLNEFIAGLTIHGPVGIPTVTDTSIDAAIDSVTAWQGRLFTSTRAVALEGNIGQITDVLVSARDGVFQLAVLIQDEESVQLGSYHLPDTRTGTAKAESTNLSPQVEHVADRVLDAKLYAMGRSVLCLGEDSITGGLCLSTVNLSTGVTCVQLLASSTHATPSSILVGGREGKEFCIVFNSGDRSWTVLDMHSTIDPSTSVVA